MKGKVSRVEERLDYFEGEARQGVRLEVYIRRTKKVSKVRCMPKRVLDLVEHFKFFLLSFLAFRLVLSFG